MNFELDEDRLRDFCKLDETYVTHLERAEKAYLSGAHKIIDAIEINCPACAKILRDSEVLDRLRGGNGIAGIAQGVKDVLLMGGSITPGDG